MKSSGRPGERVELNDIPLLIENADISRYKAADRKIRHVFPRANAELVAMVINFATSHDFDLPPITIPPVRSQFHSLSLRE